jgi:hypothetical protein
MTEQKQDWIKGTKCPACGKEGLFVGKGGYITCSHLDCPNPDYGETIQARIQEAKRNAYDQALFDSGYSEFEVGPVTRELVRATRERLRSQQEEKP